MTATSKICATFLAGTLLLAATAGSQQAVDQGEKLRALVLQKQASIVTVRAVIKTEMSIMGESHDSESRVEAQGVLVDASGLVMLANDVLNAEAPDLGGEIEMDMKVTPTEIKIVFGNEDKEYDAFMAASDSKLGLAFLKIKDLGDRKLTAIAFDGGATPKVGDEVVQVTRLAKGYDFAPYFELGRVTGELTKPRPAFMSTLSSQALPVFTMGGELVGIVASVESGEKAEDTGGGLMGMGGLMRMMGGAGGGGGGAYFILPNSAVKAVVEQAKKKADTLGKDAPAEADDKK